MNHSLCSSKALFLIPSSRKDFIDLGQITSGGSLGLLLQCSRCLLLLEVNLTLSTTLVLQTIDEFLMLPPDIVSQITHLGVPASGLETNDAKGTGDDLALHLIVGVGNTLECGKTSNGSCVERRATSGCKFLYIMRYINRE